MGGNIRLVRLASGEPASMPPFISSIGIMFASLIVSIGKALCLQATAQL